MKGGVIVSREGLFLVINIFRIFQGKKGARERMRGCD